MSKNWMKSLYNASNRILKPQRQIIRPQTSVAKSASLPQADVTCLPNGLQVASESWKSMTCTVGIWVDVGSRFENDRNNGVAHFLEHMAFKGTATRSQFDIELEVENKGGHLNAYTSREMTVYYAKCFSQDLPWAVELLSDILLNSTLDQRQIERERGVILREMQEVETQYQEVVFDLLHATAYHGGPLSRTILGPAENVQSLTRVDLRSFIDSFYRGPKIVLCGAGGLEHEFLVRLGKRYLGDLNEQPPSVDPASMNCGFRGSEIRLVDDSMPMAHVALAMEGPGWTNADSIPLMVASTLHGSWDRAQGVMGGMTSRLANIFFDQGHVHNFQNFFTCYHDTSLWGIYLTSEPAKLDQAIEIIQSEWRRLSETVTKEEVDRAKRMLQTNLVLQMDGSTQVCEELGRHMLCYGRRIPVDELLTRIESVDVDTLKNTCRRYIASKAPAVAGLGPLGSLPPYEKVVKDMMWG